MGAIFTSRGEEQEEEEQQRRRHRDDCVAVAGQEGEKEERQKGKRGNFRSEREKETDFPRASGILFVQK